jgi:hypothetical protein
MFIIIPTNAHVSSMKLILTCQSNFLLLVCALVGIIININRIFKFAWTMHSKVKSNSCDFDFNTCFFFSVLQ